jgi:energy-coupling factor transporter ATP-binding protein EcfA2
VVKMGDAISTVNLTFEYVISRLNRIKALDNVNLSIKEGDFVAIIGQNGSGKTTLAKHFNALLKPTAGHVLVKGKETKDTSVAEMAKTVGYVFQNPDQQIFAETIREEVEFGPRNIGLKEEEISRRAYDALLLVDLLDQQENSPFSLSKGEKQGLAVASIIAMGTEIIVMDEPTTGRDYFQSKKIMDLLKQLNSIGITVIFITHNMHLVAEYAKRVIVLKKGKVILDGPPEIVFRETRALESTYLKPPQITLLSHEIFGFENIVKTTVEFADKIIRRKNKLD